MLLFVLANWASRGRTLYYFGCLFFLSQIKDALKILLSRPRPFWTAESIDSLFGCPTDFGSPSGHCTLSAGLFLALLLDYWQSSNDSPKSLALIIVGSLGSCLLTKDIALSRVYIGHHSIDEVLFGGCLGIWGALYMHFCIRVKIIEIGNAIASVSKLSYMKEGMVGASILATVTAIQVLAWLIIRN